MENIVSTIAATLLRNNKSQVCSISEENALRAARALADTSAPLSYSPWRHGGWYVNNVRYPSGACGCVSRNYPDKKWRIVDDKRDGEHTYKNRDAAARAEQLLALSEYL